MEEYCDDRESCCQSSTSCRITSRKGRHCTQDESNDVEELEFGTWSKVCGEGTSDVRYPEISEVHEASP